MDWNTYLEPFIGAVSKAWRFELYRSGGNVVTVNQIIVALLFISIGIWVSRRITAALAKRLSKADHVGAHTVFFIQKLSFYLLLAIVVMVALPIAGIPITIFTVLGGALAIGVGFGAQNLFNNLISGLIIMFERPIRIGDIIELAGHNGKVMEIGGRRVRVRRTDGVDLLMPNSYFLEQPVMNWTLSDPLIRGIVRVGVAYGSDTKLVKELIMKVANENPKALKDPGPIVLFEDFGDSALIFDLLFWAEVSRPMDMRRIQSLIRYEIDAQFREHSVVIAFPQQDVHIDSTTPLDVRIMPAPADRP